MIEPTEQQPEKSRSHGRTMGKDHRVEEASIESFPASDPPSYTPTRSGSVDREVSVATGIEGSTGQDDRSLMREWATRFCASLSGRDSSLLRELLAEDVAWRPGDGALLVGRDAVMQWQAAHVERWGKVTHRLIDVRGDDTAIFIESEVMRSSGAAAPNHEAMSVRLRNNVAVRVQLYGSVYDAE